MDESQILGTHPALLEIGIREKIRLTLLDITNTHTTQAIKKSSEHINEKIAASVGRPFICLLGVSGIQKIIANAISRDIHLAGSMLVSN